MLVPRFLRFYGGYTASTVMDEMARTFFGLVNQMFRIEAQERLYRITDFSVAQTSDKAAEKVFNDLKEQYDGPDKYIEQAKLLRSIKNVN